MPTQAQILSEHPERIYMDRHNMYQGYSDVFTGSLNLHTQLDLNSTAITNFFIQKILFGGFIDNGLKDDVTNRLKASNKLGLDFNIGVTGTYTKGYLTFIAGIGHTEHFDSKFSPRVFELLLRGNKMYAGTTADISKSSLQYLNYQSLFLGLSRQLLSNNTILSGGLSVLKGGQYQQINVQRGLLFTEENGESLDLQMNFDMAYTKSNQAWIPSPEGLGASLLLGFSTWGEKWRLNSELKDLGWISWGAATTLKADSVFHYTGIEIPSILNYGNYTFNGINADTLRQQYNINKGSERINIAIPFTFAVNYTYYLSRKINVLVGARYVGNANYLPRFNLRALYFPHPKWMLSPAISYGGYGRFNFEANLVKSFQDKVLVSAGATIADYLLFPHTTSGIGANVGLSFIF